MDIEERTLGQRIAVSRRNLGLSQRQLATLVQLEPNTISMYENNTRRPSTDVVIKLAQTLHVSTDYLLLGGKMKFIDITGLKEKDVGLLCEIIEALKEHQ